MYAREGFGLWKTALLASGEPIGLCGLIKRPMLDDVDLGFALLPAHRGQGYAREAARACVAYARDVARLHRLVAIVAPGNADSIRLLAALGLRYERMLEVTPGDPVQLHAIAL
jgi:[ribosomal protein S5]-alanine N-acetyltransferase